MKLFIALSATAGMVASAAGLLAVNVSDAGTQTGLVLSYSEGSNVAASTVEPTLTEGDLQVRTTEPRRDPPAVREVEATEEPEQEPQVLATEEPEETATPEATETATPTPTATAEPTAETPPATASGHGLLDAVNSIRSSFGKPALLPDAALMSSAGSYCPTVAKYFDQYSQLSHDIGGRIGARAAAHGFTGSGTGEVLAWTANAASPGLFGEVANMWRNSSGHHALVYNPSLDWQGKPYTHAGAAYCTSPGGTGIFVVHVGSY